MMIPVSGLQNSNALSNVDESKGPKSYQSLYTQVRNDNVPRQSVAEEVVFARYEVKGFKRGLKVPT